MFKRSQNEINQTFHYVISDYYDQSVMDQEQAVSNSPSNQDLYEPRREKMDLRTYANSKAPGEPAHPRSLARSFAVCF